MPIPAKPVAAKSKAPKTQAQVDEEVRRNKVRDYVLERVYEVTGQWRSGMRTSHEVENELKTLINDVLV